MMIWKKIGFWDVYNDELWENGFVGETLVYIIYMAILLLFLSYDSKIIVLT